MENLYKKKYFFYIFFLSILILIFLREPCWLIEGSFKADDLFHYMRVNQKFAENLFYIYPGTGALMF